MLANSSSVVAVVTSVTLLAACGTAARSSPQPAPRDVFAASSALRVVEWNLSGSRASALVRNTGSAPIGPVRAVLTGRDRDGRLVATTSGNRCCVVATLAAGATAAVYGQFGPASRRIDSLTVRWVPAAGSAAPSAVVPTIRDVGMQSGDRRTLVTATLRSSLATPVRPQAVLRDRTGALVAVLAGRAVCLAAGRERTVSLGFRGPVPPGSVVSSVRAPASAGGSCGD